MVFGYSFIGPRLRVHNAQLGAHAEICVSHPKLKILIFSKINNVEGFFSDFWKET